MLAGPLRKLQGCAFCRDWDFYQPRSKLNQAFKADFVVRLLGITASILALIIMRGKAEIHKNRAQSMASTSVHFTPAVGF